MSERTGMALWSSGMRVTAYALAANSVTLTPLMGFLVGDKRPSAAATALMMLIAVFTMLIASVLALIDRRYWRRSTGTRAGR